MTAINFDPWGKESQPDETPFRRSWRPVDLGDVLDGSWTVPQPTVGRRADGVGLFYPGKTHTVASESEGGKTWFALSAVQDELIAGRHVVYLDFEDDAGPLVGRLLTLGTGREVIREQFHYVRPEGPMGSGTHADDLRALLGDVRPSLAVLDGVTEAMTLHGLNPLDNADAAKFGRMLPRKLAETGAACVSLDHVTKTAENRGRYSIGAVHKLNALDGAAYVLENRTAFGVGITGKSSVKIAKDRPGQLRKHALTAAAGLHWFGDLVLTSHNEDFAEVEVVVPEQKEAGDFRPTHLMGSICEALAKAGKPLSGAQIEALVKGKAATIRQARALLEVEGYITDKTPFQLLKPWDGGDSNA
ncbi:AAA family ATPase [Nocardioides sp. CPCC 205120]|uniref:AAA family ATPase n=1 Tax=Nocardioides sp. CPCC 205120 TaxID=3406462 RepID=UPI003B509D18